METGAEVWLRDRSGSLGWIPAVVQAKSILTNGSIEIIVVDSDGGECKFKLDDENAELNDLKLRNSETESDVENLIKLPYLHEPAILHCLEQRYNKSDIYTYTGPILIAVNPFKKVNLYSSQILETYYNTGLLKSQGVDSPVLPPHVYAIADAAYREMMKSIFGSSSGPTNNASASAPANQSILISGESGAGKTESTKIVLKYLTTAGNSSGGLDMEVGSIMDKILQSNPILESFGNARTIRNDNSSRFGKFIELNFNKRGHLIGGLIRTYLLEKVRLPKQQSRERNFHVFYQMIKGGTPEEIEEWSLSDLEYYNYTNQGGIYDLQHIDDVSEYRDMRNALNILGFPEDSQAELFRALAGLLHLGQLQFVDDSDGEGSVLEESFVGHAQMAAKLCGVSVEDLIKTLTVRIIVTPEEVYEKKLTPAQATDGRDAMAKAIYGKVFDWIVDTINASIQIDNKLVRADIGVLDIFGFECFDLNSFEQLCINYTNEALQQQFNQYVFKMEQQEYKKEKIEWSFIEFPDNHDCLQLIEHKQNGILAMIDDECKLPQPTDHKLASRMYTNLKEHSRFSVSVTQKRDYQFCIKHYAGPVVYTITTFVEKNKDELPRESTSLLQGSKAKLLSKLFAAPPAPVTKETPAKVGIKVGQNSGPSVSFQFKEQLSKLMTKIYGTTPHYIRCLKPNDDNLPDCFNRLRTTEQLRYGGVLEAVRVARSGFPVRLTHVDFFARYRPLANPYNPITHSMPRTLTKESGAAVKELCDKLMITLFDDSLGDDSGNNSKKSLHKSVSKLLELKEWKGKLGIAKESVQLGLSKVFLRKQAHDLLEARRTRRMSSAAKKLQSVYRCYLSKKLYKKTKLATLMLQRLVRGYLGRRVVENIRRLKAATLLQRHTRRFFARLKYLYFRWALMRLQSQFRGRRSRIITKYMRDEKNSLRLQRILRGLVFRHRFVRLRRALLSLQCRFRQRQAKNILRALRLEARDLGRLKQTNEDLKAEIEALKAAAAEETRRMQEEIRAKMQSDAEEAKALEFSNMQTMIETLKQQLQEERSCRAEAEAKLQVAEEKLHRYESGQGPPPTAATNKSHFLQLQSHLHPANQPQSPRSTAAVQTAEISYATIHTQTPQRGASAPSPAAIDAAVQCTPMQTDNHEHERHSSNAGTQVKSSTNSADSSSQDSQALAEVEDRSVSPVPDLVMGAASVDSEDTQDTSSAYRTADDIPESRAAVLETPKARPHRSKMSAKSLSSSPVRASNEVYVPAYLEPGRVAKEMSPAPAADSSYEDLMTALQEERAAKNEMLLELNRLRELVIQTDVPKLAPKNKKPSQTNFVRGEERFSLRMGHGRSFRARRQVHGMPQGSGSDPNAWDRHWDKEPEDDDDNQSLESDQNGNMMERVPKQSMSSMSSSSSSQVHGNRPVFNSPLTAKKTETKYMVILKNIQDMLTHKGISCRVWETQKVQKEDVVVKLDSQCQKLLFYPSAKQSLVSSLFSKDIAPIRLSDIFECIAGCDNSLGLGDDSRLLTIVCSGEHKPRLVYLQVGSKNDRNTIVTGLRALIEESQQMTSMAFNEKIASITSGQQQQQLLSSSAPSSSALMGTGAGAMFGGVQSSEDSTRQGSSRDLSAYSTTGSGSVRSSRRLSIRETILEKSVSSSSVTGGSSGGMSGSASGGAGGAPGRSRMANRVLYNANAPNSQTSTKSSDAMDKTDELVSMLAQERSANDVLHNQIKGLISDITDRDSQIEDLKKKEAELSQILINKERMYEQDAAVRMQLGIRLQQVLFDKEEALEKYESLKYQLEKLQGAR